MKELHIPQQELLRLAEHWEPEASQSPQKYRFATCVKCGRRLFLGMYHLWICVGGFKKELHMCRRCGQDYA